jgi:hypothetical protein
MISIFFGQLAYHEIEKKATEPPESTEESLRI